MEKLVAGQFFAVEGFYRLFNKLIQKHMYAEKIFKNI